MKKSTATAIAALLILGALGLSLVYLLDGANHFDGDEAVVGLMARHILEGRIPVYFYGQGYMGSLEALTAAGWFALLGPSIFALKLAPLTFYLLFLILQYRLVRRYGGLSAALLTLAITVVFSSTVILWSTKARGGFTAVLFWGTLAYLLAFRLIDGIRSGEFPWRDCLLLGTAAGLGFWTCGLVAYYFFPIVLYFVFQGGRESAPLWRAGRKLWAEGQERRRGWRPPVWWTIRAGFLLLAIYLLFALGALVWEKIDIRLLGVRVRSYHGARDLLRSGWLILAGLAALFRLGTPKKAWSRIGRRFTSRFPHLTALAGAGIVYSLIIGGISLIFLQTPGYEYGHHQTIAPVASREAAGENLSLIFTRLLPAVTGVSRVSFKFDPGDTPLLRTASRVNQATLLAAAGLAAWALAAAAFGERKRKTPERYRRLDIFFALSALGGLLALGFTSQIRDTTAYRYLIPAISWIPYFLAVLIIRAGRLWKPAGGLLAAAILGGHIVKLVPEMIEAPATSPAPAVPMIIESLREAGINRVRANYWIAYPINFLTGEEIIAAPYQSQDRYPPYSRKVAKAREVAYVFRGRIHSRQQELARVREDGRVPIREEKHPWGYLLLTRKEDNL